MMQRHGHRVEYKADAKLAMAMVRLPFLGNEQRFSLYIVLPDTVEGITSLKTTLAQHDLRKLNTPLFEGLRYSKVNLDIPKFKIESSYDLKRPLQELGVVSAFDPSTADFSGMSEVGKPSISSVVHKAVIDVNEDGTTAAAATSITMVGNAFDPRPPKEFRADRPFLFYLRDDLTGIVLFQGKFSG